MSRFDHPAAGAVFYGLVGQVAIAQALLSAVCGRVRSHEDIFVSSSANLATVVGVLAAFVAVWHAYAGAMLMLPGVWQPGANVQQTGAYVDDRGRHRKNFKFRGRWANYAAFS